MPATNKDFRPVKPGDPITADLWNEVSQQIVKLSNLGDTGNIIVTGAGPFRRPSNAGVAAVGPEPYIITEVGEGDVNVAVYRTCGLSSVTGESATGGTPYALSGDEEEDLATIAMHGVVFTGQVVLAEMIDDEENITGGWLNEMFRATVAEDIASAASGLVSLRYADYLDDPQSADVTATNIVGRGLETGNEVLVAFVSNSSGEEFVILTLTECPA